MGVQVNVAEAKEHFVEILAKVEAGEEVTVARAGRPVATIRAAQAEQSGQPRVFGGRPDLRIPDGFFFDPLPDDELAQWE